MAIHNNLSTMAIEGINEYLAASQICLRHRKADGGCLGYPAALMLFCVVNALGNYLSGDAIVVETKKRKVTRREPFLVLNHGYFGLGLKHTEIKTLEKSYRNALAHTAIIEPGAALLALDDDPPFCFPEIGVVEIRLCAFYRHVARAWDKFPKERIDQWEKARTRAK